MRHIRSLHLIDRLDKRLGGSVQATLGICKHLACAGEAVEAGGSIGPLDLLDHLDRDFPEFVTHRFPRTFPKKYANSAVFDEWFAKAVSRYDLVEIHAIFSALTLRAAQICRRVGKPYLVRPHGSLDPFDLQKHAMLKRVVGPTFIHPLLQGSAAVLLTTQLEADRLETYGAKVKKHVLPLPVSLPEMKGEREAFRSRHGIPADASVVIFMSRIDYKKGLDFLIPALGRLKAEFPNLWFILAGTGEPSFTAQVDTWLNAYGVGSFTTKTGFVSGQDKQDVFAAADMFVLASLNENFGIVNIEAMHAQLPVLISSEVYIRDEISSAGAGLVCLPEVESVTLNLRRLLESPSVRKEMGRRGAGLVSDKYRPEAATRSLLDVYREILGERPISTIL
mgnify:CR=1 FL=1